MKYFSCTTSGLVLLRNTIKEGPWNGLIYQYILHHREGRHVFYLRIEIKDVDVVYCYYLWAHEALIKDSLIPVNPNAPSDNQQKILILLVHRRWHQSLKCVLNYSPCQGRLTPNNLETSAQTCLEKEQLRNKWIQDSKLFLHITHHPSPLKHLFCSLYQVGALFSNVQHMNSPNFVGQFIFHNRFHHQTTFLLNISSFKCS